MKHTPTPWEIHDERNVAATYGPGESDWGVVADCDPTWSSVPNEQRKANAAFIVQAVNSHDEFINSAKQLLEHVDAYLEYSEAGDYDHAMDKASQSLRSAIEEAKGEL